MRLTLEQRSVFVLHHILGLPLVGGGRYARYPGKNRAFYACITRPVHCSPPWSCVCSLPVEQVKVRHASTAPRFDLAARDLVSPLGPNQASRVPRSSRFS